MTAPDLDAIAGIGEMIGGDDDEKPKRTRTRAAPKPKARSTSGLKKQLSEFFKLMGGLVSAADSFDGEVITSNADDLAEHLYTLAQQNPRVKRLLEMMLEGGAWSGVVGVLGAKVILPITVHHDLLPSGANDRLAGVFGIPVRERTEKREREAAKSERAEHSPGEVPPTMQVDDPFPQFQTEAEKAARADGD